MLRIAEKKRDTNVRKSEESSYIIIINFLRKLINLVEHGLCKEEKRKGKKRREEGENYEDRIEKWSRTK